MGWGFLIILTKTKRGKKRKMKGWREEWGKKKAGKIFKKKTNTEILFNRLNHPNAVLFGQ